MNYIVLGIGLGDEGKGLVTDWLCSNARKPSVVCRFSGGHQCGHTVVLAGKRHVFSSFGSGTMRGVPTYWSHFCTVDPIAFMNELKVLQSKDIEPSIFIDATCPITTPYEMIRNRTLEQGNKHGSCGVGFGATMQREEDFYSITFFDLFFPDILRAKMDSIQKNYYQNYGLCDLNLFYECCAKMVKLINIKPEPPSGVQDRIFEGSQGLMLDQHFGIFPNVTRSNTGSKNALIVAKGEEMDEVYLVTRAYQTRHGNGWLSNEHIAHQILENPLETNKEHEYQGKFRRAILDVSLIEYAINKDTDIRNHPNKKLVITCLDHITLDYRFTYQKEIIQCANETEFVSKIADKLGIYNIYLSRTDESKYIYEFTGR